VEGHADDVGAGELRRRGDGEGSGTAHLDTGHRALQLVSKAVLIHSRRTGPNKNGYDKVCRMSQKQPIATNLYAALVGNLLGISCSTAMHVTLIYSFISPSCVVAQNKRINAANRN